MHISSAEVQNIEIAKQIPDKDVYLIEFWNAKSQTYRWFASFNVVQRVSRSSPNNYHNWSS